MPQWRKLHTKTVESIDLNEMPDDFTRLFWVLLPLGLDSEGRCTDNSIFIRSKIFPMRCDVTLEQVESAMAWFANRGMIERYRVDGRNYFQAVNFHKYQGKTDREAASVIPDPVKHKGKGRSRPTHEPVMSQSVLDSDVDSEKNRKEEKEQGADAPDVPPPVTQKRIPEKTTAKKGGEYLDHPAVIAYRDKMLVTPNVAGRKAIVERVKDLSLWEKTLSDWLVNKYNPQNLAGLLNKYSGQNGRTNGTYSPDHKKPDKPLSHAQAAARRLSGK